MKGNRSLYYKIFALYLRVNLVEKPEWFDVFRLKYDKPYDLHLTLIQPRHVDETQIDELKSKIATFLETHKLPPNELTLDFGNLKEDHKPDGTVFMLFASNVERLLEFQQALRDELKEYENYTEEVRRQYETDFKPHITVGRNVSDTDLKEAEEYFRNPYSVKGDVSELVLAVVAEDNVKEAKDPQNLTVYNL